MSSALIPNRIKKTQKLRVVRYFGQEKISIFCTRSGVDDTLDSTTASAVHQALNAILQHPCKGVAARFNGVDIQVDLL